MAKETLTKLLVVSIIFNLILGGTVLKKSRDFNKQTEITLYNYCRDTYYVYSDLDDKLFKSDELTNSEYVQNSLGEAAVRLRTAGDNASKLKIQDKNLSKIIDEGKLSSASDYFSLLSLKLDKNKKLEEKDITNLKEVIKYGKLFGTYAESGPNYNKKFDSEHPFTKIAKLYEDIYKIYINDLKTK